MKLLKNSWQNMGEEIATYPLEADFTPQYCPCSFIVRRPTVHLRNGKQTMDYMFVAQFANQVDAENFINLSNELEVK